MTAKFYNENYNCTIKFILTEDYIKTIAPIYKKAKINIVPEISEGEVITYSSELFFLVINKNYFSWNTIFHEIYHLTSSICELRNISDEEAKSWVAGWIGGKLTQFFKKKKLEPTCG